MATIDEGPIVGQIALFGFAFSMYGWANANGSQLPIDQHEDLFSVFSSSIGGPTSPNATTFPLPNLALPNQINSWPVLTYQVALNGTYPIR